MLRIRRYRIFLIFSIIFILSLFQFLRSRDWSPPPEPAAPPVEVAGPPKAPAGDTKEDLFLSHGFAPESPVGKSKPEEEPLGAKNPVDHVGKPDLDLDPAPVTTSFKTTPTTVPADLKAEKPSHEPSHAHSPGVFNEEFGPEGQGRLEVILPDADRPAPHWKKLPEHFPVPPAELIRLPTGQPKALPKLQANFKDESTTEKIERMQKLTAIKESFQHAWNGYKQSAMGHDEVRPVTGGWRDPFAGWGATLVDALDTLWIMDLKDEFSAAVDEVKKIDFTTTFRKDIPLFETTIRYLGGLLGAYDISGHKYRVLLDKAVELAEILIGSFDTPNRMPVTYYYWAPDYVSQPHRAGTRVVLAELGSLSMEFTRLAQLTKDDKYYDAIARITNELEKMQNNTRLPGMWPLQLDASGCKKKGRPIDRLPPLKEEKEKETVPDVPTPRMPQRAPPTDINSYKSYMKRDEVSGLQVDAQPANYGEAQSTPAPTPFFEPACEEQGLTSPPYSTTDKFGLGGQSDSTYEYLPKEYMLLGGLNEQYRTLYETAMDTVRKYLLFRPMIKEDRDIRFAATVAVSDPKPGEDDRSLNYVYEGTHLTCFAGGMFAVGAKLFGLEGDMDIAAQLTDGCVWAYESTKTGIMPETFEVLPCEDVRSCEWDETRYRDALDPSMSTRIQRRVQLAEETQEQKDTAVPSPAAKSETSNLPLSKRDVPSAEQLQEHNDQTPTKTIPKANDRGSIQSIPSSGSAPSPKPSVLSHDDYVDTRIKEERLPSGFTKISSRKYILRPEAIESVFIMFRLTGDNYWREKGWEMFEAITKSTRTELAHSSIVDVTSETPMFTNVMESFWLAETLKYFYLLFSDPSVVSLDEYVFNTEAHPLKRPSS
ncbi:hypothetical protein VTN77DRAFT_8824 [Rasamsonia byssochlamydoides]|uniref:uncharacterized protein n=1 Tax=Rasamsonia byssochlamydoides TaxID=89139 RepID=UPI00374401FE